MSPARALLLAVPLFLLAACHKPDAPAAGNVAPDLAADASRWLNGAPLPLSAARGSVVLVDAWGLG